MAGCGEIESLRIADCELRIADCGLPRITRAFACAVRLAPGAAEPVSSCDWWIDEVVRWWNQELTT